MSKTSIFKSMDVLSSGLAAQRLRMNLTSQNLANAQTTRTAEGGPYRRKDPVFAAVSAGGSNPAAGSGDFEGSLQKVAVAGIAEDQRPFPLVHDPSHPDADPDTGMVAMPNVNVVEEMINMITSSRSYEANVTAYEALKQMANKAMEIGR